MCTCPEAGCTLGTAEGNFLETGPVKGNYFIFNLILPAMKLRKSQENGVSWPRITELQSGRWGPPAQVGLRPSPQTRDPHSRSVSPQRTSIVP